MRGKRLITLLLTLVLIITMIPVPVQAAKGGKLVALTFDDGPHPTYTKKLLDGLKERGVKVTFFMLGENAARYPELVRRAYDEGHEVASHTYSHLNLNVVATSKVRSEVRNTANVLNNATDAGTDYLVRPPYGNANASVLSAMGAPAIIWSVDTNDWKYKNANTIASHIKTNASDGAIILCHDIYSTTVTGALSGIDALLAKGYEFVTVSELYRRRGMTLSDGVRYAKCSSTGTDHGPVEKPIISYEPVEGGVRVTIASPSGAPVYYNTDGSRFSQSSKKYTGSFVTSCPVEINAVAAFNLNGGRSDVTNCKITYLPCEMPDIQIKDGVATITCITPDVPIYYTLDNTQATTSSALYNGSIEIDPGTTVRAVAGGGKYLVSREDVLHYSVNGNIFSDVFPEDWYYENIDQLATEQLMNGVGQDAFAPLGETTRAMLVTLLYRCSGETLEDEWERTNTFTDVEDGMWYSAAIEWAYRNQVVEGYPDNTFGCDKAITRQEMAKVFVGYLATRGINLDTTVECKDSFVDGEEIAEWAQEYVNAIVSSGLMKGNDLSEFNPEDSAIRAEAGTVLLRMIALEENWVEPEKPVEPEEPEDPEQPVDPEKPEDPEEPELPTDPENPEDGPEQPFKPGDDIILPGKPVKPGDEIPVPTDPTKPPVPEIM